MPFWQRKRNYGDDAMHANDAASAESTNVKRKELDELYARGQVGYDVGFSQLKKDPNSKHAQRPFD